jgi:hypothetical protein
MNCFLLGQAVSAATISNPRDAGKAGTHAADALYPANSRKMPCFQRNSIYRNKVGYQNV